MVKHTTAFLQSRFFLFLFFVSLFTNLALPQEGWVQVSTLPAAPSVNSIAVVDEDVIWAVCGGGLVYLSVDAGNTWSLRNTGLPTSSLYGASALDSLECWVGTRFGGSVYRTANGGISWTLQIAVPGSFVNGIHMFDINNGVYTGDPTGNGEPYQNRFTTDGGTTWTLSPTSPIGFDDLGLVNSWDWIDQNTFWLGSADTTSGATSAKIFYTTTGFDGTWNFTSVPGTGGTTGLYYQAIAFTDAMHGMAGSNRSNLLKTSDGGVTWQSVNPPPGLTSFSAINFSGLKDGSNTIRLVLSHSNISYVYKTTDFGSTYTEETIPSAASTNGLQHMVFLNANLGYAGGAAGVFLKYTGTVPVEMTSFTANALSGKVVLNWSTATETNNQGFQIERRLINGDNRGNLELRWIQTGEWYHNRTPCVFLYR